MTAAPAWADFELSNALPALALAGETQAVEFKREFPKQLSDLAKEIAGFGTSNAGVIYVGVGDDSEIVGLEGAVDHATRASYVQRVEGLCANAVKPSITPSIRFACVDGKVVLAIAVPKGDAPIYYAGNIPYLRQLTAARPMSPDEVIAAVLGAYQRDDDRPTPESYFLSRLASLLVDADIAIEELRIRDLNPWYEDLKYQLGVVAERARELAASSPHEMEPTIEPLEQLAASCEIIAGDEPMLGGPNVEFVAALDEAETVVKRLRARWLGPGRFSQQIAADQANRVRVTAKLLDGFVARITTNPDEQTEAKIHDAARERGREILEVASLGVGVGDEPSRKTLWDIGMAIRELETRELFFDDGASQRELLEAFRKENQRLQAWMAQLTAH